MAPASMVPPLMVSAGRILHRTPSLAHCRVQESELFHPLPGMQPCQLPSVMTHIGFIKLECSKA